MKVKHLTLLVAVLGGVSVATFLLKRGDDAPLIDPREGQPVIDEALLKQVSALRVHTPTSDVDLARSDATGNRWIVRSYHGLPADFSKIKTLTDGLEKAKIIRFASAQPDRIAKMGFDGTSLELRGADDKPLRTLHLGKNVESGGRFIKLDEETKTYVASFGAYLDATAKNWADATLLPAKPEEVIALEVSFPDGGPLHLKRENGTAPWTAEGLAEGEKLKDSEVSSLVSKLTGLRFNETADPAADEVTAARANARTFKVTLTTGKSFDVALGRKPAAPAPPAPPPAETPAETPPTAEGAEPATPPTPPAPPPPGPVYVFVTSSDPNDAINDLMQRRGFQIYEWTYTSLPANRAALVEATPPPPPAPTPTPAPAQETTPPESTPAAEPAPEAASTPAANP